MTFFQDYFREMRKLGHREFRVVIEPASEDDQGPMHFYVSPVGATEKEQDFAVSGDMVLTAPYPHKKEGG